MNYSKYKLAICIPFHPEIYGITNQSDKNICEHLLIHHTIESQLFLDNYHETEEMLVDVYHYYSDIITSSHPIIRNYSNMVNSENHFKIDIIEEDILSGSECVGYIKTIWLKLIQRKWKKIFKERKEKIRMLSNPKRLMKREMMGK